MNPSELVVLTFVIAPTAGIAGTAYLWILYRSDPARPRSWLLAMLVRGAVIKNVVAVYFAAIATARLADAEIPRWTFFLTALALLCLEAIPVYYAAVMYGRGRAAKARQR